MICFSHQQRVQYAAHVDDDDDYSGRGQRLLVLHRIAVDVGGGRQEELRSEGQEPGQARDGRQG